MLTSDGRALVIYLQSTHPIGATALSIACDLMTLCVDRLYPYQNDQSHDTKCSQSSRVQVGLITRSHLTGQQVGSEIIHINNQLVDINN